jgi:hypothetical protein
MKINNLFTNNTINKYIRMIINGEIAERCNDFNGSLYYDLHPSVNIVVQSLVNPLQLCYGAGSTPAFAFYVHSRQPV